MRFCRRLAFLLFSITLAGAVIAAQQQPAKSGKPKRPSELHIDSGELLSSSGMPIHVSHFDALVGGEQKAEPRAKGTRPVVTIQRGTASLSRDAITMLLNSHLSSNKVKNVSVETAPNKVTIKGKAHKVVDVPFQIDGRITATADGLIRLQVGDEHAAHLPDSVTKLLGFDDLSKIVGSNADHGVKADKNSVTFDPDLMWGLPIHGRVVKAITTTNGLNLTFGPDHAGGSAPAR